MKQIHFLSTTAENLRNRAASAPPSPAPIRSAVSARNNVNLKAFSKHAFLSSLLQFIAHLGAGHLKDDSNPDPNFLGVPQMDTHTLHLHHHIPSCSAKTHWCCDLITDIFILLP